MCTSKTFFISKYIVLALPKKNFSSIRGGQHPSTSANIFTLEQGTNLAICRFWTWNHHHNLPVNGGILIYVPHLVLRRPSWGPLPGGQRDGGHGGAQHDHGECHQYCLSHLYQNAITHRRWIHIMRTITRWTASRGTWGSPSWSWRILSKLLVAPFSKCRNTVETISHKPLLYDF